MSKIYTKGGITFKKDNSGIKRVKTGTYTKGGITFQRNPYTGKLKRIQGSGTVNKIQVAVAKDKKGKSVAVPVTKSNFAEINNLVNQKKTEKASRFFTDPVSGRFSVDPNKLTIRTVKPIINKRTGLVSGYYDTLNKRTVGFSGKGVSQQQILRIEKPRYEREIRRRAYDYFINPNKKSVDPNLLGSLTTKPIIKNNKVYGYYDLVNKTSVGFSSPLSKQDFFNFELRRKEQLSSLPKQKLLLPKTSTEK